MNGLSNTDYKYSLDPSTGPYAHLPCCTFPLNPKNQSKTLTIWIQHARNIKILLGHIEGSVKILQRIVFGQLSVVDQIWTMAMDEGAEGQAILQKIQNSCTN